MFFSEKRCRRLRRGKILPGFVSGMLDVLEERIVPVTAVFNEQLTAAVLEYAPAAQKPVIQEPNVTGNQGEQAPWIDAGDHYWSDGQRITLYRRTDEVAVTIRAGADIEILTADLAARGGICDRLRAERIVDNDVVTLAVDAEELDDVSSVLAELDDTGTIERASYVFVNSESGLRQVVTDELVVALRPGVEPETYFASDTFSGYRPLLGSPDQFVATVVSDDPLAVLQLAELIAQEDAVGWAAPNFYQEVARSTNDPLYSSQWHLNNTGQSTGAADADIDAPEAWNDATGSGVVIAILDDGVQTNHPDLNIWQNPGEIAGNNIDDDGNGWVDDVNGWNFAAFTNNPNPSDSDDNHGTAVAGVAAAKGNNSLGVAGAAYNAQIMPLKMASGSSYVSDADLAQAIYYAGGRTANGSGTWRGADVLNFSWSWGSSTTVTTAFSWTTTNGRGGRGTPAFSAAGNTVVYEPCDLTGIPAGTWLVEWRYEKDGNTTEGSDCVWLANVKFPNGTRERFDNSASLPTGWLTRGDALWSVADDPSHAFSTGRYEAKSGPITHNQQSILRSPSVVTTSTGTLHFDVWTSTEGGWDKLQVYVSNNNGASWNGPYIGASGNYTMNASVKYPASLSSTIGVGATADWDYRSSYSHYGYGLDFVAPGGEGVDASGILTTDRTGSAGYSTSDYASVPGTSFASPLAAGVGALLISAKPDITAAQVRQIMRDTADKVGRVTYSGGFNTYYGYGRINAAAALAAVAPAFNLSAPTSGTYTAGAGVPILWTATNVVSGSTISLCYDEDTTWWNGNEHWITIDQIAAVNGNDSYSWNTIGVAAGTYYVAGYMHTPSGRFILSHLTGAVQIQPAPQQQFFVLSGPVSGTITAGDIVPVTWTASGVVAGSKISLCYDQDTTWWNGNEHWIAVDSIAAANGDGYYNWNTSQVAAGSYYMAGYMYDYAGTFTYSHLTGAIQIQPGQQQSFVLTAPTSGTYTAGNVVSIAWTAAGVVPGSTISLCYDQDTTWWNGNEHWIVVDGIQAANGSYSYNWNTAGVSAGTYYVAGYMYDYAGTFTYSHLTQAIQIQPGQQQSFVLTTPTSGTYTAGNVVSIAWTAAAVVPGSKISLCYDQDTTWWNGNEHWIVVDGIQAANGSYSYNWNTTGVSAGTYYVAGYMYDYAGTFTYSHLTQAIQIQQSQQQSFVLTAPTSGTYTAGNVVSIAWTAAGVVPGSKISLCYDQDTTWWNGNEHWIVVDGIQAANGSYSYNWNTTGVSAGTYYVAGYMYDYAGTFTYSRLTQAIQIQPGQQQAFVLTAPTSGTYTAGNVVSIAWTAAGVVPGSKISLCYDQDTTWWNGNEHWIVVDGIQAANGSYSYNWNTTGVSAGTYYVAGYMYDYAGTFTYSHLTQAIQIQQSQQQSLVLTAPTSGTYTAGDVVSIAWTAAGVVPRSKISLCYDEDTTWWNGNEHWIVVDGIQAANGSYSYNWATTGVSAGTYYVAGYMYDYAGTFTYSHLTQAIQIQPGQQQSLVLTAPTSGTYTAGDVVHIAWTASGVVPGSTISLCYDEDTTWWNGNEHWIIVDGIQATNGSYAYNWYTTGVGAGTYYVGGYMYDNAGTFTYSHCTQAIQIGLGAALRAGAGGREANHYEPEE